MENVLGRQLWSIYEDLQRGNRIGFLTDDEFQNRSRSEKMLE